MHECLVLCLGAVESEGVAGDVLAVEDYVGAVAEALSYECGTSVLKLMKRLWSEAELE